ncbi:MAG: tetratricopeptide repeat protein, partial [Cyclobacteriaceae bacterium]
MRAKILIGLLFTLSLTKSFSQPRSFIDSLKSDLNTVSDDSLRFRLLDELAWTYKRIDADSALAYGKMGIEAAKKLKDEQFQAFAYSTFGVIKLENDLLDYGVSDLKTSLSINQRNQDQRGISSNYNNLGNAYNSLGKYDSSIIYYTESIKIKMEIGLEASAASTMSNLGLVYMEVENAEKALEYFQKALEIVGEDSRRANGIFNNMGIAYSKLNQSSMARRYLKKAIRNLTLEGSERQFAQTYNNIAESFQDDQLYDSAIYYALKSYDLKKKHGSGLDLTFSAITLSKIYGETGDFVNAKIFASEALNIAKEYDNPERLAESTWALGVVEARLGNFKESSDLFQEYIGINEKLTQGEILAAAEEAEAKFQNELKEKENQLLREETAIQDSKIRIQTLLIWASISVALLLLVIAYLARKRSLERKKLLEKIESQAQKLQELDKAK